MAYSYLLDLYRVLSQRQEEIITTCEGHATTSFEEKYRQGRLAANNDFLLFLRENYHRKLPRRLQKT